jgi:hypothetical protein
VKGILCGVPLLSVRHSSCGVGMKVVSSTLDVEEPARFLQIGIAPKKFGGPPKESLIDASL